MIPFPLTKPNRLALARAFRNHTRVDMGIDCAIEDQMGSAFVDDAHMPSAFLVEQGGFFAYLAGDPHTTAARELAAALSGPKIIMPSAVSGRDPWTSLLHDAHGASLIAIDRYRFSGHTISGAGLQGLLDQSPHRDAIQRIDANLAQQLYAQPDAYLDLADYDSPHDFCDRSIGYAFHTGQEGASPRAGGVAYGSLACSRGIEVSIFVQPAYRRRGVATALAAALLLHCGQHNMDANWDAANPESCALALRLGYTALGPYTAHFLRAPS